MLVLVLSFMVLYVHINHKAYSQGRADGGGGRVRVLLEQLVADGRRGVCRDYGGVPLVIIESTKGWG